MSGICFPEETKIVNVYSPADFSGGAMTTEWICMKHAQKATFFLSLGVLGASADSMAVTLNVANNASGTKSATAAANMDLTLPYYYKGGANPSDTFTKTSVSSSTWTIASNDDGRIIVVEVNASEMGRFTSGSSTYEADYVRLAVATPGASALISCMCILTGLRYKEDSPPTSIL
jgi:hypothetical protein